MGIDQKKVKNYKITLLDSNPIIYCHNSITATLSKQLTFVFSLKMRS